MNDTRDSSVAHGGGQLGNERALRYAEPAAEAHRFQLTIRHLLARALLTAPDQRIVYRDHGSYTYRQFAERVTRLASTLATLGAGHGTTVAIMDWDSHRYLESYFAVPMMGAVLQTVNVRLPNAQIAYTLRHAGAEILLVHRDFFPLLAAILPEVPRLRAVIIITDDPVDELPSWATGEYEQLLGAARAGFDFEDLDENAIATTFFTTGTTGRPKGVTFSHRQLVLHAITANAPFGGSNAVPCLAPGDVYMPLTPMFHVHAWGVPYVATMLGLKQVYPGRYESALICRLRREHGVTFSHGVPTILQMLLKASETTGVSLEGWKMIIGGSALTKALLLEARRRGMDVVSGYGMSETCPTISIAMHPAAGSVDESVLAETLTAAGVPIPLVHARIVNEAMEDVPHDGVTRGELVLRAPWLTSGYTEDAVASESLWRGGWLHTQDVATMDANGCIRIRDRLKDVIKSGGEWIDSLQLEDLLGSVEGVVEAVVIAVPDEHWGERPLAVIVAQPHAVMSLDVLNAPIERAIAAGAITRYARLDRFELVDEIPRTSVGKPDKKAVRARFGTGSAVTI